MLIALTIWVSVDMIDRPGYDLITRLIFLITAQFLSASAHTRSKSDRIRMCHRAAQ